MSLADTAQAAHRAASAVMYGGAATSAASGGVMAMQTYFGFSPAEWQVIGIIGGLVFAFLGWVTKLVYTHLDHRLKVRRAMAELED